MQITSLPPVCAVDYYGDILIAFPELYHIPARDTVSKKALDITMPGFIGRAEAFCPDWIPEPEY